MRRYTLVLVSLLAGCGGTNEATVDSTPLLPELDGMRPHPEQGWPHTEPKLEICHRVEEPDRPYFDPPPLDGAGNPTLRVQTRLPEEANSGVGNTTYWLTGGESMLIELGVLAGTGWEGPPHELDVFVFVDGRQVSPIIEGIELLGHRFTLSPGEQTAFSLELGPELVPRGRHLVSVSVADRAGFSIGLGPSIVAIRDESCWTDQLRYLDTEALPFESDWWGLLMMVDPRTGRSLLSQAAEMPLEAGNGILVEIVHVPSGTVETELSYVVALMDGIQVPFNGYGFNPVLLAQRGIGKKFLLEIPPEFIPPEGGMVDLFLLKGAHRASEDESGNRIEEVYNIADRISHFEVTR